MKNDGFLLLNVYALIILVILEIIFLSKERQHKVEDNTYGSLLIVSIVTIFFGLLLGMLVDGSFIYNKVNIILFNKAYLIGLILTISIFTFYTFCISHIQFKDFKKIVKLCIMLCVINVFVIVVLPLDVEIINDSIVTSGLAITYTYLIFGCLYFLLVILVLMDLKNIKNKKYIPVVLLIIEGIVITIIQIFNPSFNYIINPSTVLNCLVMYFTIENPDVKMLNELIENRKIIERSSEEKSIFLFKMSQGIKEPSKNIEKEITKYEEGKNTKEKVDNIIQNIEKENGKINYLVNDVMGLTSFDGSKIKKVEGSYNIYSLLEDIKVRAKGYKKNDIDYTFTTVENIPKELIGDRVAIKQVLMSLIINAFNNTSKGYVHVDVNSITKYDVCRLVITIEDSGSGIEINKINEILNQEEELTNEEYLKLDKIDIDLPLSYKIIKSLGGTMYIRSEVGKGTSITITLDQYIIEGEDEKKSKRIEEYIKDKNSLGKILLVDDNEKEISKIKKYLNKKGYDVSLVMYGEEVIKRIKVKEKYDYIIIDDELETMSGISLLKELNKEKYKSKKIVILNKDKLFISDHYIEDGFNDYIDRENLIKELDRLF